ncbi:CheR family methyltransferase, partial [Desulfocurvibacter africanus]|uniref:CheR family methyltransferase n=1 Tax=Desulfocurvibacter africanus TaxID=873 RepID=UPI002FD8E740
LETFFGNLPDSPPIAFVVIQHLDPARKSLMAELLGRRTSLKVIQADDGLALEPGKVYTLPPDKDLLLHDGVLALAPREKTRVRHMVIDRFFRSLAEDMGPRAVGIVLTGAGSDGSQGIKEIKAAGGMVMVQDQAQAEYASMPASAIATGQADFILPIEQIPRELLRYLEHPYMEPDKGEPEARPTSDEQIMRRILLKVRRVTGHDFSGYKRNTILRRIERRMALQRVESLGDYQNLLNQSPDEVQRLFLDLIILVTNFFRDSRAFEALKHKAIVPLLREMKDAELLRVWVPGCATGEEAYSVAMLFLEAMDELGLYTRLKIFGTDINPQALKAAREGVYPGNISADVSEERLARFFDKRGEGYVVKDTLREIMVFAAHDLTRDPPFSKLNLVSCRNLLIYMDSALQKRIIPIFHYCLAPGGYLFLGTSEGVGEFANLFVPVQKKWKIFRARDSGRIMRKSKQRPPREPHLTPITHEHAASRRESPRESPGWLLEEGPNER